MLPTRQGRAVAVRIKGTQGLILLQRSLRGTDNTVQDAPAPRLRSQRDGTSNVTDTSLETHHRSNSSRLGALALPAILFLAAGLRFGGVGEVGIRFDDESAYVTDARLWHRCASLLIDPEAIRAVFRKDKRAFQKRMDEMGIDFTARYVKPSQGYTFLAAAMMFVVGEGPAALLVLGALCGTLTVVVLYALGRLLFGQSIALCAALLLAVSPYHLSFCRGAWPYVPAALLVLTGLWFWSLGQSGRWSMRKAYFLAGLAIGWAATCHFSSAYMVGAVMLIDLLFHRGAMSDDRPTAASWRVLARRWGWLAIGAAVPVLAIEMVFQAAHLAARVTDSYLPLETYFKSCRHWARVYTRVDLTAPTMGLVNWRAPIAYAGYFVRWHGVLAGGALVVGLLAALRAKGTLRMPAVVVVFVLALLALQRHTVARSALTVVPLACLCTAVGLHAVARRCRAVPAPIHALTAVMTLLLVVPASVQAYELFRWRSDIGRACSFVEAQGGGIVAVPRDTCYGTKYGAFWDERRATIRMIPYQPDPKKNVIAALGHSGVRWVITDPQHWQYWRGHQQGGGEGFRRWHQLGEQLERRTARVAEFPHVADFRWPYLVEGSGLDALPEMIRCGGGPIRVYDLSAPPPPFQPSLPR